MLSDLELHRLSQVSPPSPLLRLQAARSPPDHKLSTLKARSGPASLRAAGQQHCSSSLAESSACPKAWARLREALSLCRFAPNRRKEQTGRATRARAFVFSPLLSIRRQHRTQKGWKGKRGVEQSYLLLIQSSFKGTMVINGLRGILF